MLFYNYKGSAEPWFGRDPYFLSCGREVDGTILFSQPEIALFDRLYHGGTSGGGYPDFIVSGSLGGDDAGLDVHIITAQKGLPQPAKSHVYLAWVDSALTSGLLNQHHSSGLPEGAAPLLELTIKDQGQSFLLPSLAATGDVSFLRSIQPRPQRGFSVNIVLEKHHLSRAGDVLFRSEHMSLAVSELSGQPQPPLYFAFSDSNGTAFNASVGKVCTSMMLSSSISELSIIVDGGAGLVFFVVNGTFCDDGWFWVDNNMGPVPASSNLTLSPDYHGTVVHFSIYDKALRTSEAVALNRYHT
jgi:hypothetical protein